MCICASTMAYLWLIMISVSVVGARDGLFDDDLYQNVLDQELCQEQLGGMRAFEFYDASFRIPQGLLTGNLVNLGNYDQCLRINQETESGRIQGKYCMIGFTGQEEIDIPLLSEQSWSEQLAWRKLNISEITKELTKYELVINKLARLGRVEHTTLWHNSRIFNTVPISLALCMPKTCTVNDVLGPILNNSLVPFGVTEQYCRLPEDKPFSGADYTAIVIFSIIGFITTLSTGYDLYCQFVLKEANKKANKLYCCFSVYTNTNRLMTFTEKSGSLDCLDGMRSLSILWIILGHVYSNYLIIYAINLSEFFEWFGKRRAIWLLSADVAVDTFFTMSGLLLVYTTTNKMTPMKLLKNLHWFYLNRLLRMFPLLACVVLLQASVFFRVTDGPNWWFLGSQCVPQTWYVSVDVQLHILSPLLLFWVLRGRLSAWRSFTIGLVAALTANTVYCFFNDFSDGGDYFKYYYYNTLIRAPPFIIGMIFGYFLHTVRDRKVYMPVTLVITGSLLALFGSSYAMYQEYPEWNNPIIEDLNLSFEKSLWALANCWMIFICVCGYGGPINWFLSLKIWKFVARISYAMYIFHFSIMFMHAGSMTLPFYYSMENIVASAKPPKPEVEPHGSEQTDTTVEIANTDRIDKEDI
ncbi:hypothetical protein MSG28_006231 [Choristoneura fumiferana]|uniref:Uncharacterized protein n=1 Tax=Choristoneura fumiferana TaxID=7141 RepID=A0ACC0JE75_CHOFU|nr:hypothetical protein MSG28_006231 [Choristoneura fumiferana]